MDKVVGLVLGGLILYLMAAWVFIPEMQTLGPGEVSSLTLANGIFSGWADELITWMMYNSNAYESANAKEAFRNATLMAEAKFPALVLIFSLVGAFFSIGGVVAVWLARSAASAGAAFSMGFFAEIGESILFLLGYKATTGLFVLSREEAFVTLGIAGIMGLIAVWIYSAAQKGSNKNA